MTRWMVFGVLGLTACGELTRAEEILRLDVDVAAGETLYDANCVICHSDDGSGGVGSDIRELEDTVILDALLVNPSGMPSYDGLTDQELADLTAFAESL